MVGLLRNDIEEATNKRFGFSDHVKVLRHKKTKNGDIVVQVVSVTMSYFTPKGKARLKPVYLYQVYKTEAGDLMGLTRHHNKTESNKIYNSIK